MSRITHGLIIAILYDASARQLVIFLFKCNGILFSKLLSCFFFSEQVSFTSDNRSPTPEQNLGWAPLSQPIQRTHYSNINANIEKSEETLKNYLCSLHLRDFQRLQKRFLEISVTSSSQDPSNWSKTDFDVNPHKTSISDAINTDEESLSTARLNVSSEYSIPR